MIMISIYLAISVWSAWCVLSHQVRDGVFGKVLYSALSITGLMPVFNHDVSFQLIDHTLLFCFAGIGLRHFVLVKIKERSGKHGKHKST